MGKILNNATKGHVENMLIEIERGFGVPAIVSNDDYYEQLSNWKAEIIDCREAGNLEKATEIATVAIEMIQELDN